MKIYLIILLFVICACTDNDEKKSIPLQPISTNPPASTKQNWNEFGDNVYYDEKSIKTIQGITSTMLLINQPKKGLQKSFLRISHPIKSMAYELFIGEKLSFAEVS